MGTFLSRRSLVGSLRALTSAEMAALGCIAAARNGFLLAALHSVAERVNPRKARPPAPHGPRVLTSGDVPIYRCWEKSAQFRGAARTRALSLAIFSTPGTHRDGSQKGNEAADRGGGGVRWGSPGKRGQTTAGGTPAHGGLSLRPNGARRGKIQCAPSRCISAQPFLQTRRRAGFCRATAENFRPRKFSKRARP